MLLTTQWRPLQVETSLATRVSKIEFGLLKVESMSEFQCPLAFKHTRNWPSYRDLTVAPYLEPVKTTLIWTAEWQTSDAMSQIFGDVALALQALEESLQSEVWPNASNASNATRHLFFWIVMPYPQGSNVSLCVARRSGTFPGMGPPFRHQCARRLLPSFFWVILGVLCFDHFWSVFLCVGATPRYLHQSDRVKVEK